ncbi:hypothetical protein PINS_up010070 [Pythium insidiosum]|nr:hypothetical protein PINS_up010070 [Pythium insidiosum]
MKFFTPVLMLALVAVATAQPTTPPPTGAPAPTTAASGTPAASSGAPASGAPAPSGGADTQVPATGEPPKGGNHTDNHDDKKEKHMASGSGDEYEHEEVSSSSGHKDSDKVGGSDKKATTVPSPTTNSAVNANVAWQSAVTASAVVALALSLL